MEPPLPPPSQPTDAAVQPPPQPDAAPPQPTELQSELLPPEPTAAPAEPAAQPEPLPLDPEPQANSVTPAPETVAPALPTQPEATPAERPRKKRKLEEVGFENSTYFKIRTIVKNLRPSFLQVFQNPNFRETNLAGDILKDIKIVLELSKQLHTDLAALTKPQKASSIPPIKDDALQGDESSVPENATNNLTEEGLPNSDDILKEEAGSELKDVPKNLEDGFKGSYVVGGSPVGWNFLVYPGRKPFYYGRSKAEKQARQTAEKLARQTAENLEESIC